MNCNIFGIVETGKFFEILVGRRSESLWSLLSKIGVLYALEPIFTIIFIINMTIIWENVMASLRAQIFGRMLVQKVQLVKLERNIYIVAN